jgi:hypothetical protein
VQIDPLINPVPNPVFAGIGNFRPRDWLRLNQGGARHFGFGDLALGDRVAPVLEALIRAGGGRFSAVRYSVGYDADSTIGNSRPDSAPHIYARPDVRAGVARLSSTRNQVPLDAGNCAAEIELKRSYLQLWIVIESQPSCERIP